jgi:hypothetical protein
MSWIGWAVIGLFVFVIAIMAYMVWIIYKDDQRRGRR